MGSGLMYALTNQEAVAQTLATFAVHAHPGTLLILDINNAASYLGGGGFQTEREFVVDTPLFKARGVSRHCGHLTSGCCSERSEESLGFSTSSVGSVAPGEGKRIARIQPLTPPVHAVRQKQLLPGRGIRCAKRRVTQWHMLSLVKHLFRFSRLLPLSSIREPAAAHPITHSLDGWR
jgi:hypothetical protein